ncbi:hypothetical protein BDF20DRAFT_861049 [Mycotypha africana]|uniref:uncharacterized protein n=1 Tax=Mycotypha africana TaxID=64632 RepID=UPI0022FFD9FC|nr:uncharacterized protein BDF20DRAFT_861049 [Mycotypha africana]KAI8984646.1 hypothetical protein BDF20DRAFT_861049 [Mycotypha africana]
MSEKHLSSYESYLSNLDSLIFGSPDIATQSEKDINEELALWSNTQFTFDFKPKSIINVTEGTDIEKKQLLVKSPEVVAAAEQFEKATGLDPLTYESLANYLDCELPRQQGVNLMATVRNNNSISNNDTISAKRRPSESLTAAVAPVTPVTTRRILPRPLAPAPVSPALSNSMPTIAPAPISKRQILLPKTTLESTSIAIPSSTTTTTIKLTPQKRSKPSDELLINEEKSTKGNVQLDDDKRRRNTAASARFREKKKLREQAMEQSVREMTLKSNKLQERVDQLEQEIKFLRDLLLDKVVVVKPTTASSTATAPTDQNQ